MTSLMLMGRAVGRLFSGDSALHLPHHSRMHHLCGVLMELMFLVQSVILQHGARLLVQVVILQHLSQDIPPFVDLRVVWLTSMIGQRVDGQVPEMPAMVKVLMGIRPWPVVVVSRSEDSFQLSLAVQFGHQSIEKRKECIILVSRWIVSDLHL